MNEFYLLIALLICFSLFATFLYLYIKNIQEFNRLRKLRNDFTAMIIHELRSPLSLVRSSADMLIREAVSLNQEQITTLLTQMRDSSTELLEIVNDLLDVSKIESGRIELFKRNVDINKLLDLEITRYRSLARNKGIAVNAELDHTVEMISCDEEKMKQVMNNLLSNAIKFTNEGYVNVKTTKSHNYLQVEISDSGVGIPAALKAKLFQKFVQARDLPVSREKGTGLGLVIVKGIIEAHGGKVWVEDNLPRGSKFIFTLPC